MFVKGFQCFSLLTFLASDFVPFSLLCLYSSSFCTCRNHSLEQRSQSVVLSSCNQDHTSTCSNNRMEIKALYTLARSFSHRLIPLYYFTKSFSSCHFQFGDLILFILTFYILIVCLVIIVFLLKLTNI